MSVAPEIPLEQAFEDDRSVFVLGGEFQRFLFF